MRNLGKNIREIDAPSELGGSKKNLLMNFTVFKTSFQPGEFGEMLDMKRLALFNSCLTVYHFLSYDT